MVLNDADGGNQTAAKGRDEVRKRDRTVHQARQSNRYCCPVLDGDADEVDATSGDHVGGTDVGRAASLPDVEASHNGVGSRRYRRASRICRLSSMAFKRNHTTTKKLEF